MKSKTEIFIEKSNLKHNNFYDYSKTVYTRATEKVLINCPIHGDFSQLPNNHKKSGCPKCGNIKIGNFQRGTFEVFLEKAKVIHKNKYDYSLVDYKKDKEKIKIICKKHGQFWQMPYAHLKGQGCKKCISEANTSSTEKFITKANKKHKFKYDYSLVLYKNSKRKVTIICKEHGNFLQIPNGHLNGFGCPQCGSKYISEDKLFQFLKANLKTEVILQYKPLWLGLQSLDIFLPKYNLAVEYQGIQHFKPIRKFGGKLKYEKVKILDKRKFDLCKTNNCKLYYFNYFQKEIPDVYLDKVYNNEQELLKEIKTIING